MVWVGISKESCIALTVIDGEITNAHRCTEVQAKNIVLFLDFTLMKYFDKPHTVRRIMRHRKLTTN